MRAVAWLVLLLSSAACAGHRAGRPPESRSHYRLAAEVVLRPAPAPGAPRFGGISGLIALRDGREMLAVSDDRDGSRVIRLRLLDAPAPRFEIAGTILLQTGGAAPAKLDPEGIALTPEGHILISSEGIGNEEPRLPPSVVEYSPDGRFIGQFAVPSRYHPTATGPLLTGVRDNGGFESLSMSPDAERLFTAGELPLIQDGTADAFTTGAVVRVLEYVRGGAGYTPGREFAYELEPLEHPAHPVRFAVNGLVELLALSRTDLLALERGFVESEDGANTMNRIRIFRISLDGATDVSGVESLRNAAGRVVRKTLVADLNALPNLSPSLRTLDNFEGLGWGAPSANGVRPLIVVSDDNFNPRQVTAFLFLRPAGR